LCGSPDIGVSPKSQFKTEILISTDICDIRRNMKSHNYSRLVVLSAIVSMSALPYSLASVAAGMKVITSPDEVTWGTAPPELQPGAQLAVISGDPSKAGTIYLLRVKMPDGYKFAPHWHPKNVNVTVISGSMGIGMGDKFDEKRGELVKTGGFVLEPRQMHHYAWAHRPTVIEVYGEGPFAINYVNPSDDPRTHH
jgi:hypothetical protein